MTYGVELQGLVNYYTRAVDVGIKMHSVKWAMTTSLLKTLACKHRQTIAWVCRRYKQWTDEGLVMFKVEIEREGKQPLTATFGGKPISYDPRAFVSESVPHVWATRSELVTRLLADQCELCGSTHHVQVHHIRKPPAAGGKLKDIQLRYQGKSDPPDWIKRMIAIRRKTLVVCADCHHKIHAGSYDGRSLKQGKLES